MADHCHGLQEKKRLEDTIFELRQQSEMAQSQTTSSGTGPAAPVTTAPLSEESQAVVRELEVPEDSKMIVVELNEARQEVQRLTEEVR